MSWNATHCASQYLGMKEVPGHKANPAILAMLQMDSNWPTDDSVPWCSGFVNWIAFNLGLERTRSLRARSWLFIGTEITLGEVQMGDIVIFSRGSWRPDATVLEAPGHVAFVDEFRGDRVWVVGGNQGDAVSRKSYPMRDVLGFRRLARIVEGVVEEPVSKPGLPDLLTVNGLNYRLV